MYTVYKQGVPLRFTAGGIPRIFCYTRVLYSSTVLRTVLTVHAFVSVLSCLELCSDWLHEILGEIQGSTRKKKRACEVGTEGFYEGKKKWSLCECPIVSGYCNSIKGNLAV